MTLQTVPRANDRPAVSKLRPADAGGLRRFLFSATVVFCWLYFYRPEDFIPGLTHIPMAKIVGIIAMVALFIGMMGGGQWKMPRAIKILWLLLAQMMLCIPFAIWRGGAFSTVVDKISKGIVMATLISMAVTTVKEIRKLLWIQVSAVALVTIVSILVGHSRDGRLEGVQKSILENPNDLAINIAISFPLGVAFMLHAKGGVKKAVWAIALLFMGLGIVLTYSRSGLLAFILTIIVCIWEYGIKGKRRSLVIGTAMVFILGLAAALSTSHYRARVESILLGNIEGSHDKGSLEARKALLRKSINVAFTHPLFGVGPGCFVLVDKGWVVAHNTYTELAAEAGIPALILFLMAMAASFRNLAVMRKSRHYQEDPEFKLFTQAIGAGLVAYLAGACFASTEYLMYTYLLVAYTCAMVGITTQELPSPAETSGGQRLTRFKYDRVPRPQPVGVR